MTIEAIVFDAYGTLYDVQSIESAVEARFPGHGGFMTQIWRMKQLEYTWFRSMMGQYEDFWAVTREALAFTIGLFGFEADGSTLDTIAEAYNNLAPYPEAKSMLESLSRYRLAILSNGSPGMLRALTQNSGMNRLLETVISVDEKRAYKPDPRAYELVEERLRVTPDKVLFVSSNGFDISGAMRFGFKVARVERMTPEALRAELAASAVVSASAMFKALRARAEAIGPPPHVVIDSLSGLVALDAGSNF